MNRTPLLFVVMFFISCKSNKERLNDMISDSWSIEEFYYLDENHMDSLRYNVISFNFPNQGDIYIPKSYGQEGERSRFELINHNGAFKIEIYSKNEVFNGTYNVNWVDKGSGIKQLNLISEKVNIKAYKRGFGEY